MEPATATILSGAASGAMGSGLNALFNMGKGGGQKPAEIKTSMPTSQIQPLVKQQTMTPMPSGGNLPMPTNQGYAQDLLNRGL